MAKKKEVIDENLVRLREDLTTDKVVLGTERTLKALRNGLLARIYLANNCAELAEADIRAYAGISDVEVIVLAYPNDEVGTICKKPFSISVVGVKK